MKENNHTINDRCTRIHGGNCQKIYYERLKKKQFK